MEMKQRRLILLGLDAARNVLKAAPEGDITATKATIVEIIGRSLAILNGELDKK